MSSTQNFPDSSNNFPQGNVKCVNIILAYDPGKINRRPPPTNNQFHESKQTKETETNTRVPGCYEGIRQSMEQSNHVCTRQ